MPPKKPLNEEAARRAAQILTQFNNWRRDTEDKGYEMPNPKDIGIAIDYAIEALKKYMHEQSSEAQKSRRLPEKKDGHNRG